MLELQQVSMRFGGLTVLRDVTLTVPAGGIYGLIGPNGAGKTTLFNILTGLLVPSSGQVRFEGRDLAGCAPHEITRRGIARTFQNIRLFREMSVLDNVVVGMHARLDYGIAAMLGNLASFRAGEAQARARALELLSWMGLAHKAGAAADSLSYGEQRKLEFARALATEPRLLLLDEPVAGMNPREKSALMDEILAIRARGYSILLIEHDMRFVMNLCDRVAVLNFGGVIAEGRPAAIKRDPAVIEAYLGKDDAA